MSFIEKSKKRNSKKNNFPPKKEGKINAKSEIRNNTEDDELVSTVKDNKKNKKKQKRGSKKMSRRLSKMGTILKNKELQIKETEQNQFKSEKDDKNNDDIIIVDNENKNKKY